MPRRNHRSRKQKPSKTAERKLLAKVAGRYAEPLAEDPHEWHDGTWNDPAAGRRARTS